MVSGRKYGKKNCVLTARGEVADDVGGVRGVADEDPLLGVGAVVGVAYDGGLVCSATYKYNG